AMTICGLATGSEHGFIYIRGEYPEAESAIGAAIEQARAAGLLGPSVAGSGHAFEIEIRRGGGAYICGEETSLVNSLEGKRGEPRSKPPFPAQIGVFGKPTVVNNVETLVNVLDILVEGSTAWARTGTAGSTGTRLFCLSGHVAKPGLYEIECGQTLRHAIDLAGGIPGGRALQAVLLGGAAGTFVGPDALDMPLSFEGARAANATLGSGVIMVFDDTADLLDTLARIAQFFRDESCGQCVPCRVGTVRQEELLRGRASAGVGLAHRSVGGGGSRESQELLGELGQAMRDASICGLGQTAASAIESAFANIPSLKGTGS
ncbi:MAG: NADH-ubiquinone oxidoreductase-F iron-sulfur binding region domain-containing protein, partial [Acidobacteriota bacterium]|nr:NADH-ubiquinone oxidoreductase-F iron-sulfur binding region domain-containing protein [Acidobacteriota bacterium]